MFFLTPIIGILINLSLPYIFDGLGSNLFKKVEAVATIVSTFALALVSLLAGIIILVTSLKDSYFSRRFKSSGGYSDYMFVYFYTIVTIFFTHCSTIPAHVSFCWFKIMLSSMLVNILLALFLTISAYCLTNKNENSINQ